MANSLDNVNRILDKASLQFQLSFMALFIGLYECMKKHFVSRTEALTCDRLKNDKKGNRVFDHNELYKEITKGRIINGRKVKDEFLNIIQWLKELNAINEEEASLVAQLREKRNLYAHDMPNLIRNGVPECDAKSLFDLLQIFNKLDKWWINEIEIPITAEAEVADNYDKNSVVSVDLLAFKVMINTLYGNESDDIINDNNG